MRVKQDKIRWFNKMPFINMNFDFEEIPFSKIMTNESSNLNIANSIISLLIKTKPGDACNKVHPKGSFFNEQHIDVTKILPTIRSQNTYYVNRKNHKNKFDKLNDEEIILASSFPLDYDFCGNKPIYVCGMSVPPVMMANVAYRVKKWWFDKLQY